MLLLKQTDYPQRKKAYQWFAVALFIGLALLFNAPYLTRLPQGFMEWPQSDRLALALGYYDYRFDFFHPRTLSLVTVDRVTGTELPLQAYIASFFGLLAGRHNINVAFRCLDLAMMVVGFYYLFRLVYESTGNFVAGLVPAAFLLASPTFIYYSGNYTPDPFSVSILFIAIYHYWRFYYHDRQFRHLLVATALAGLAMLIKITAGVYFFSFTGAFLLVSYLWPDVMTRRQKIQFLGVAALVLLALLSYLLYHEHLNKAYGAGLFLNKALPIESRAVHRSVWATVRAGWLAQYFTHADYTLLKISWAVVALYLLVRWRRARLHLPVFLAFGLAVTGIALLYLLLGTQLIAHDYYPMAPLLPLLVMVVCMALWVLCRVGRQRGQHLLTLLLLLATVVPTVAGLRHHRARMQDPYKPYSDSFVFRWQVGGEEKLKRLGVPESSFILVLGEGPPNLALVHFNRLGVVWNPDITKITADSVLRQMAGRRLEYLIMRRGLLDEIKQKNAALLTPFREVQLEGESAILQPRQPPTQW